LQLKIPTIDLISMISRLRPLKPLTTRGYEFVVYTLEASQNKLRLIVSDKSALTAYVEAFAEVKEAGKLSVNGTDFYENIIKITPENKSNKSSSKEVIMQSTGTTLNLETDSLYKESEQTVKQLREFHLISANLNVNDQDRPTQLNFKVRGDYFLEMLKTTVKLVSTYTSDITSLSGILIRVRNKSMVMVVSDGTRILEATYPEEVIVEDLDILLPKATAMLLQSLVESADLIDIYADYRRAKFYVDTDGLGVYLASSLVRGAFPEYAPIFIDSDLGFKCNTKVLLDNVMNIRRSIDDDTYRVHLNYDGGSKLSISNKKSNSHVGFSNDGIKVEGKGGEKFTIMMNALLFEGLLTLFQSTDISLVAPPPAKPVLVYSEHNGIKYRAAIARAVD